MTVYYFLKYQLAYEMPKGLQGMFHDPQMVSLTAFRISFWQNHSNHT